jgi:hypothetical protein
MKRQDIMNVSQIHFDESLDFVITTEIHGEGDITGLEENIKSHADYDSKKTEITAEYNTYQASKKTPEEIDAIKASAKQKLIAGEALTEEEADTIVL